MKDQRAFREVDEAWETLLRGIHTDEDMKAYQKALSVLGAVVDLDDDRSEALIYAIKAYHLYWMEKSDAYIVANAANQEDLDALHREAQRAYKEACRAADLDGGQLPMYDPAKRREEKIHCERMLSEFLAYREQE